MSPRGVYYLEVDCGENARAALDYLNHYRSPHLLALDTDYAMSIAYQARSWPTFAVVDQEGVIRFHGFPSDQNLTQLRQCVEGLLRKSPGAAPAVALTNGIAFPAGLLAARGAVRERSPRLVLDAAGSPVVFFYSNREGQNAVYLRRFSASGEPQDERLSQPGVESYAPDGAFDAAGTLWVVWCARQAEVYNLWVLSRPAQGAPATEQLTFSREDVMSPRLAIGADGTVAVAYYEWHKLWGASRDRDVFTRIYDPRQRRWSEPLEVSPHEPEVEDHTDPVLVVGPTGKVWVAWSYDYHPQLFKSPVAADQPTIFAASVVAGRVSPPLLVGMTGNYRHAVDLFPSVALDSRGALWCAWDASQPARSIRLARLNESTNAFQLTNTFTAGGGICSTPELSLAAENRLLLAWSERQRGFWRGRVALLQEGKAVAECALEEAADVMFPQARQNPAGQTWVVYEKADAKGSTILKRDLTEALRPGTAKPPKQ